ncbi:MAG TPA: sec-independent translocase [Actinomycetes bacterium]|nr:sec-independent translocase [Actinomycetes bacterium]
MFDVSPLEILTIAVIALLIFGPDKLPKLAADAARLLREIRRLATGARQELTESLGPELRDLNLAELNPATFVKRNLLDPIEEEVNGVKADLSGLDGKSLSDDKASRRPADQSPTVNGAVGDNGAADGAAGATAPAPAFDPDTT